MSLPVRPADPNYLVEDFAPDADYPAGGNSWNGQATKVSPPGASSVGLSPNQGNAAQYHNYLHNRRVVEGNSAKAAIAASLDWTGQAPALSFHTEVTVSNPLAMKYSPTLRKWLACGGTDGFKRTADVLTWPGATEIPAPQRTTHECYDFDVDPSGNIVVVPDGIDAVQECDAAGTWALHLAPFGGLAFATGNVVYDAFSGRWIAMSQEVAVSPPTIGSTDRVTWSTLTTPGLSGGSFPTLGSGSTVLSGNIVVQGFNGTNVQFSHSSDGGTTWSTPQTFALGFTQALASTQRLPKPVWNGSYWLAVAFSSGTASKVFKSVDGVTWTNVATFANAAITSIACMGDLWLGATVAAEYLVSTDGGVTWKWGDRKLVASPSTSTLPSLVMTDGIRFLLASQSKVYPGDTAFGNGLAVAT